MSSKTPPSAKQVRCHLPLAGEALGAGSLPPLLRGGADRSRRWGCRTGLFIDKKNGAKNQITKIIILCYLLRKAVFMGMNFPEMIIFDFGHTLVYEETWDGLRGSEAVLEYAVSNKNNLTAEQVSEIDLQLFTDTLAARRILIEPHHHKFQKLLYEYLQIEINLSPVELERVYWDNASKGHAMPNILGVLDYLYKNNIRTGVISNISFSGEALKNRIDSILPGNHFEFFIASSEYIFMKPSKIIFELALRKANLEAGKVWYCGDDVERDIHGASSVGIYPVWYESELECWYKAKTHGFMPECEHLHIKNWLELIDILESLKK